jgi:hypothetical protein
VANKLPPETFQPHYSGVYGWTSFFWKNSWLAVSSQLEEWNSFDAKVRQVLGSRGAVCNTIAWVPSVHLIMTYLIMAKNINKINKIHL